MIDINERLLAVLLGTPAAADEASRALSADGAWPRAIELARVWRVIPELRRRIAGSIALDDGAARLLRDYGIAAAAESTAIVHRAAVVLGRLSAAGVPAAAFKGVGLIGNLYASAAERMVSDVDLLVCGDQLGAACAVLRELGFTLATEDLDEYVEFLRARPGEGALAGQHALVLKHSAGAEIDLHWRLGTRVPPSFEASEIIARSEVREVYRLPMRVVAPADAIALTVHHMLRDQFAPWSAVKDICDLAAWWRVQVDRWSIDAVVAHARRAHLAVPLLAAWSLLADLDPSSPARAGVDVLVAAASRAEIADARRLRDLFRLQLSGPPLNGDLLRLLSARASWQFLTRRLGRSAETAAFARRLEDHLGLEPVATLAERLRRLGAAIAGLTPRRLAAYRALLRVHRRGGGLDSST